MIKVNPSKWEYLKQSILKRKRTKICITCNQFRYSTTETFATVLIFQDTKNVYHSVIIYLKVESIGKTIGLYFFLKLRNYSSIKFFQVEIFNYVNKALFYTTSRNLFNYFNNYDSILLFHISISCAYFFCTFVRCPRIGFINSNILGSNKLFFNYFFFFDIISKIFKK